MKPSRATAVLGVVGPVLLLVLWLTAKFFPRESDSLLRPYGLFVWLGVLAASILLPTIAAIRGSRWWLLVVAVCLAMTIWFFKALMA